MLAVAISVLFTLSNFKNWANANPQVPCYFVFGDSQSDNGNNNNLSTLAKVNYPPYGIDFPNGPTGRFSNGRNAQDFIVEFLGFEQHIPPFANSEKENITNGVNYASGSAGILDESGIHLGVRIPLNEQIKNHKTIISRITSLIGNDSTTNLLLNQCIYAIQIGSNDFINNLFNNATHYNNYHHYTRPDFAALLVDKLSFQLKTLYDNGARKFAVFGMGMIGYTPLTMTNVSNIGPYNDGSQQFNERLTSLLDELNKNLTDASFTFINVTGIQPDQSMSVRTKPCCDIGFGGGELCIPESTPCTNRSQYIFWDGVHPTEAWNENVAKSAYGGSLLEASPLNIQQLAKKSSVGSVASLKTSPGK